MLIVIAVNLILGACGTRARWPTLVAAASVAASFVQLHFANAWRIKAGAAPIRPDDIVLSVIITVAIAFAAYFVGLGGRALARKMRKE